MDDTIRKVAVGIVIAMVAVVVFTFGVQFVIKLLIDNWAGILAVGAIIVGLIIFKRKQDEKENKV